MSCLSFTAVHSLWTIIETTWRKQATEAQDQEGISESDPLLERDYISITVDEPNGDNSFAAVDPPDGAIWSHRNPPTLIISTATPRATDEASDISLSSERSLRHRRIHSAEVTTTGEENEQALAAIGDQFQVENSIDTDPIRMLQSQFWDCQVEWPEGGNQYFIPADDLRRLVTVDSIRNQLKCSKSDLPENRLLEMAESACKSAFKLFAILVCANRVSHFYNFLQEGLSDDDLPFIRLSGSKKIFELHSSRHPNKPILSLRSWPLFQVKHFSRDQYQMLAPIFKKSHLVEHYDLLDNQVLPFIEDQVRDLAKSGGVGGFGSVWAVRMHPAHQFLHRDANPGVSNPVLAIKQLFSTQEEDFKLEVEMLKAFSNHQYRHLIKLLATYRYQGRYHLVFPYAKFNLRQYWKDTPTPEFSITTVRWMLSQCKGIATGLHAIHDYRNTNERQLISLNDGLLHPGMMENERRFGRHGDIKPENILWSDENIADAHGNRNELGCLLIADFGLMEFHRKITRSKVKPDSIVCSPTYAPPELALRTHISRAYDIWSLGCVFLEFIIWLVLGWQELEGFPAARDSPLSDGSTDDTFYTIRNEGSKPHAIVRPSVTEWVEKLHSAPRCSAFVHEFLNLISENMLAVKAGERVECGILVSKLANMLKRAEKDHEYLTRLIPLPRQEKLTVSRNQTSPRMMSESPPPSPTDGKALPRTPIAPNFDVLARLPLSQHSSQIESATGRNRENDSGARRFDGAGSGIRRVKST